VVKLEFDRLLTDIPQGVASHILGQADRHPPAGRADPIKAENRRNGE
jgi:hypothetical protein